MTSYEFRRYCRAFSTTRDKAAVFDRYYTPDAVFEHPFKGTFRDKAAIVRFWTTGHRGIREVIKPRSILICGNRIAAELLIEWHCEQDTNYLGPRRKGEVYRADCAAFYKLRCGRFAHVKLYLTAHDQPKH